MPNERVAEMKHDNVIWKGLEVNAFFKKRNIERPILVAEITLPMNLDVFLVGMEGLVT